MPSLSHELLLQLLREQPTLAADLVREALGSELPEYTAARIESADLTDIKPTEYRADLVVLLRLREQPVMGIVVEVQFRRDPDKPFTWPVYVTTLRARLRCPTRLLVVTAKEHVAHWARTALEVGGGSFVPWVFSLSAMAEITDPQYAREHPEMAVLAAVGHGRDPDADNRCAWRSSRRRPVPISTRSAARCILISF